MPLNLLKHKSYHVGNTKNLERVRRDEERAAAEREEKLKIQRAVNIQRLRERRGVDKLLADKTDSNTKPIVDRLKDTELQAPQNTNEVAPTLIGEHRLGKDPKTTKRKGRNDSYFTFRAMDPTEKKRLKIEDEAVKQRLDPLADIIKGVQETTRYERRKKMSTRLGKK